MIAFIRGTWIAVLMIAIPLSDKTASKAAVYLLSWSRINGNVRFELSEWVCSGGDSVAQQVVVRRLIWAA